MLSVLEFTEPAGAGATEPYLCRLSDEEFYYVKGRSLLCDGLINEYICAAFGHRLGLPLPDFELVELPDRLGSMLPSAGHLGFGPVFASKRVPALDDFDMTRVASVPPQLRMDVVAFDYWIGNLDRSLTVFGGNPNLFWDLSKDHLVVLDHNLAFDSEFTVESLALNHPFSSDLATILADSALKINYAKRFHDIMKNWNGVIQQLPQAWFYRDANQYDDAGIDLLKKEQWLLRLCDANNWGM